MKKVWGYSLLLITGLVLSQFLPGIASITHLLLVICLAFIMIRVGLEFEIDKSHPKQYAWDYFVAVMAAGLPWILVAIYFMTFLTPNNWHETLLLSRFSAPTSAGILFAMLAAAGLSSTWVFKKARILAIFDDLDTVLLMIPLQMWMIGFAPQLLWVAVLMGLLLWAAWRFLHQFRWPTGWKAVLLYAVGVALFCEMFPVHLEVLLPAFALGCVMIPPSHSESQVEARAVDVITGLFLLLVGLSMPVIRNSGASEILLSAPMVTIHVLSVTLLSNIGKMFSLFCYKREASFKERLAVSIAMFPRGEVGAGVLAISMGYGIGGPAMTIAMLSLALNLALTGVFIIGVKKLIQK